MACGFSQTRTLARDALLEMVSLAVELNEGRIRRKADWPVPSI